MKSNEQAAADYAQAHPMPAGLSAAMFSAMITNAFMAGTSHGIETANHIWQSSLETGETK